MPTFVYKVPPHGSIEEGGPNHLNTAVDLNKRPPGSYVTVRPLLVGFSCYM